VETWTSGLTHRTANAEPLKRGIPNGPGEVVVNHPIA